MGGGSPLLVFAAVLFGYPLPLVRIELDNRVRFSASLLEPAHQHRQDPPLQGRDEQQEAGDIGQKPGNEQQHSGEDGERPGNPGAEGL